MEQNEKYYVPDLSELHVGFEYEEYLPSYEAQFSGNVINTSKWVSKKCTDIIANNLSHNIDMGVIRVKRLDHDDIVGEGWVYSPVMFKSLPPDTENGLNRYELISDGVTYTSQHYVDKKRVIIVDPMWTLFDGEIRNVSELRFIMKRLGIKK